MTWTGRRVLVTGAGGFIGSHLAEALVRAGARVRALVRYNSFSRRGWLDESPLAQDMEIIAGDVCDAGQMHASMKDIDIVYHMAALVGVPYSYAAISSNVRVNVEGTLNVLEAARQAGVQRFVLASSSQVYGTALEVPIKETHPLQAQSPYSATKIAAEKLAESYFRAFDLPVVILRVFCTFGPRQSTRAIVPTIVTQLLNGASVKLGSITPIRDYNYFEDSVASFMLAGIEPKAVGRTVNIAGNNEVSIGDLAAKIANLIGRPLRIETDPARVRPENSEVLRLLGSNALADELLGWQQQVDLDEALRRTIEWYRDNLRQFRAERYNV